MLICVATDRKSTLLQHGCNQSRMLQLRRIFAADVNVPHPDECGT